MELFSFFLYEECKYSENQYHCVWTSVLHDFACIIFLIKYCTHCFALHSRVHMFDAVRPAIWVVFVRACACTCASAPSMHMCLMSEHRVANFSALGSSLFALAMRWLALPANSKTHLACAPLLYNPAFIFLLSAF